MATLSITPTTHVTPDNDVVTAEIFIAAPRERIFEALTDPKQAVRWWGQNGRYRCDEFIMDARVGGKWSTTGKSVQMGDFEIHGEFLELDPPRRLAYTWSATWMPAVTKVLWELETQANGTRVRLTHTGFAGDVKQTTGHRDGWALALAWLQGFAERGETVDNRI
jgi:uncharacterized protein YndB with AHSA1/START domain